MTEPQSNWLKQAMRKCFPGATYSVEEQHICCECGCECITPEITLIITSEATRTEFRDAKREFYKQARKEQWSLYKRSGIIRAYGEEIV